MCIDPPGKRLERFAICTCGACFPECDYEDYLEHGSAEGAYNHNWVYVNSKWLGDNDEQKSSKQANEPAP